MTPLLSKNMIDLKQLLKLNNSMRYIKISIILLLLLISVKSYSQQSEQYYFNKAAKEYYNGNNNAASKTLKDGLNVYPNDSKLLELKKGLGVDPKAAQREKYNQQVHNLENQGFQKGAGSNGDNHKSIVDPDGVTHDFFKKTLGTSQSKSPSPDGQNDDGKWNTFKKQEKNLLSNGYQKGAGDDRALEKTLNDPNGEAHVYFKKKEVKTIMINSAFRVLSQNKMAWSEDLKNNAESITIVFDNGFKKFTDDVTNRNNYLFESGDKDFDGVQCTVTLIIVLKSHVKLTDKPSLKLMTHC